VKPLPNPNPPKTFAHPIEDEFAKLLDFYRIPWEHEPTCFPLALNEDGIITEAFTPDFYLPSQDLFIELTTRRQAQITEKNRKIRLLREHYPEVNIKLLNREDMRSLFTKYGFDARTGTLLGKPRGQDENE
jgi:hypoxanthine phosphoribosyltransferase